MVPEVSANSDGGVESSSGGHKKMENGFNCSANGSRSSGDCNGDGNSMDPLSRKIHTYKRKKCGESSSEPKLAQLEKLVNKSISQSEDKMVEEILDIGLQKKSCEQVCCPKMKCHSLLNGSGDFSYQHWKSTLQDLSHPVTSDQGGMTGVEACIRDALCSVQQMDYSKASIDYAMEGQCHAQQATETKRCLNNIEGNSVLPSNESSSNLNNFTVTRQCQRGLFRLVMSEKFKSFCKLLSENFQGVNTRMKEGAYEQAPALFASDIQELWKKVHVIGTEMITIAKSLSDLSRLFCREMVRGGSMENGKSDVENKEFLPCFDWADRREQSNGSTSKAMTCRQCEKKSDGRDCLVCDSCEEIFHVSCIKPAVTEIPYSNWYCAKCTALGNACPHESCVVCERLNVTTRSYEFEDEKIPDELEQSSGCIVENGIQIYRGNKRACCKVCKSTLEHGELFRLCEHHACNHYYHVRCLTNKQLKCYCSRWYCPCCLCRVCLTDKDDDKIVLCDACDNAYHIYCMSPPQNSIPEGQWYCRKCEAGIQAILKAKLAYNSLEEKEQKKTDDKKRMRGSNSGRKPVKVGRKVVDRSGGVDMLLNAASAISDQEHMAALSNTTTLRERQRQIDLNSCLTPLYEAVCVSSPNAMPPAYHPEPQ
ncbi:hypothetical protein V2J09_007639 [Rumex salicifolius]